MSQQNIYLRVYFWYSYIHSIIVTSRGCTFKFQRTRYPLTSHPTQTINNAIHSVFFIDWHCLFIDPHVFAHTIINRISKVSINCSLFNAIPVFILPVERAAIQCKDLANKFENAFCANWMCHCVLHCICHCVLLLTVALNIYVIVSRIDQRIVLIPH